MNVATAARLVGISYHRFYYLVNCGHYPAPDVRIGRRSYYSKNQIEKLKRKVEEESKIAM